MTDHSINMISFVERKEMSKIHFLTEFCFRKYRCRIEVFFEHTCVSYFTCAIEPLTKCSIMKRHGVQFMLDARILYP